MWIDKDGNLSKGWVIIEMTFVDKEGKEFTQLMKVINPTDEQYIQAGYHWEEPPAPEPDPEYERRRQEYLAACGQFRTVCGMIKEFAGLEKFTGGFDEAMEFIQSAPFMANMVQGTYLFSLWQGADKAATYAADKAGLGQPEWWYDCWSQVEPEPEAESEPETPETFEESIEGEPVDDDTSENIPDDQVEGDSENGEEAPAN